ncbi:hypothetical protein AVEN_225019-1 [Araneus ventricosus]|uniref:Uncharacterized protein n=1 Tax=Araneus ventricosus TaxID=182803 RepID=A0A4Y2GXJ7_ARAVE|nr:hypothetical protein AVEN_225019-1 [Araneus ventricosus]
MKTDTFVIPMEEFSNTLFVKGCRQNVQVGFHGVLKLFIGAEALSSQTCLQLSKKGERPLYLSLTPLGQLAEQGLHKRQTSVLFHLHHERQFSYL